MTYSEDTLTLLTNGDIKEAKKKFAWALRKDDDDILYSLAEELYSLGFTNMAKRTYEKLLERYPKEDELRTSLADIAIAEGNDDEALNYLQTISSDSSAYLESLLVAADLYQTQGIFEVSEQKLLTAYKLAPEQEVIRFALAEFYYNVKKYSQARDFYLSLIKQGVFEFSKVNLIQRLGMSYVADGHFEQALGYLEQIPYEKLDADSLFQLAFTYKQLDDLDNAQKNFEKLKQTNPDYATLYPALADIYEQKGNISQALITIQEGLAVDEFNTALYQKAAEYTQKLGYPEKASAYLNEALVQDPENMTLVLELSNLYLVTSEDQKNIVLITNYLNNNEVDAQLYWNLGRSYARLDDYEHALVNYQAAQKDMENVPEFLHDASFFYRNAGEREKAIKCIRAYLKLDPNNMEINQLQEELEY
ncbi:tetratricopeptide repeat protein [Ligilactobacillus sp. WILCCON 0076]|uniref:Tetratricopeptide repeat protein n=1 Tax=Ligilactobacillus ubinensis TaxID=2876789 RepID=A0A9X2FPG2_9LACO|nr:tetratricopeptide repeat protein [Ligilactobacillus ubinensis]MCP0887691.1 tetratricopeptide repeat protein [Ligilactobacillus ubinensis]